MACVYTENNLGDFFYKMTIFFLKLSDNQTILEKMLILRKRSDFLIYFHEQTMHGICMDMLRGTQDIPPGKKVRKKLYFFMGISRQDGCYE